MPKFKNQNKINEIASRIVMLRMLRRMSQTEVANTLGVTFQMVQKYEQGLTDFTITRLYQLAGLFNVTIAYLLEGDERSGENSVGVGCVVKSYYLKGDRGF